MVLAKHAHRGGVKKYAFGRLVWFFLASFSIMNSMKILSKLVIHKEISSFSEVAVAPSTISSSESNSSLILHEYDLADKESNGFFKDITNSQWKLLKQIAHDIQPNTYGDPNEDRPPSIWFQEHFEPEISCMFERRIGKKGDGGKWVCDPHRIVEEDNDCLVYSVGSNGDASFEASVLKEISPDCEIHVFDFGDFEETVKAQTGQVSNVHYHMWGIDGSTDAGRNLKSFDDTISELGHTNRTINLFKIDCEGCEINSFKLFVDAPVILQQVLVEIHPNFYAEEGPKMYLPETTDLFRTMHDHGYAITHKEPNTLGCRGDCIEYSFLLLTPEFWKDAKE